ncbi:hypothetical protein [Halobacillus sp. A5]|uniref:hypothetical protein n=1 Tax=Halobacillus sp. A5 TaxID=2880263 RepID=UPI0020A66561|nr:hypothetical protein [Halobacillus sp. A5]
MSLLFKYLKKQIVASVLLSMVMTGAAVCAPSQDAEVMSWKQQLKQQEDLKYTAEIIEGVYKTLREKTKGSLPIEDALKTINEMPKVEIMDSYLDHFEEKVPPEKVRKIINQVYNIDLNAVSDLDAGNSNGYPDNIIEGVKQSLNPKEVDHSYINNLSKAEVMNLYMQTLDGKVNGDEIRALVNEIFGINLDGISHLEGSGVSLFSKNQWISQYDQDLFVVHTGLTDVDVWVYPTEYFTQETGLNELPDALQKALEEIGFSYNKEIGAYYYSNPGGTSVPDSFKEQTLGTIIEVIEAYYSDLKTGSKAQPALDP